MWGRGDVHRGFWWGNMWERDYLQDLGVDGKRMLIWNFKKWDGKAWTGLIWTRIWTGGGHL
jgi:hypothetical protein